MFCLLRCIVQFKRCVDYKLKFLVDNKTRIPLPRLDDTRTDVTAIFIDQTSPVYVVTIVWRLWAYTRWGKLGLYSENWIFNLRDAYQHISESFISVTCKPKQQVLQLFDRSEHVKEQLHAQCVQQNPGALLLL